MPSPISVQLAISRGDEVNDQHGISHFLSFFFPPLSIPMPLTHPSSNAVYQSSPAVRSTTDTVSLSISLSLFPSSLHTHAPHPSQQYHRLSVVIGSEVNNRHSLSLSLHFFPLSPSRLPIFTMPSFIIGYTNHHQPGPISTIPLWWPLLPSFLLPIIDSHLSPPILASPHLLSIRHLWSSFPCSHDYHHYSSPFFLSQTSTTAP